MTIYYLVFPDRSHIERAQYALSKFPEFTQTKRLIESQIQVMIREGKW